MTVQELIDRLSEFPPNALVNVFNVNGEYVHVSNVAENSSAYARDWAGVKSQVYVN